MKKNSKDIKDIKTIKPESKMVHPLSFQGRWIKDSKGNIQFLSNTENNESTLPNQNTRGNID